MSPIDRQIMLASGRLISISEAARHTPYSGEYLSLLARKGRLKAVKISRDWLTTREAVLEYVEKQAIKHQKILSSLKSVSFGGGIMKVTELEADRALYHHEDDGMGKSGGAI